MYLYAFIVIGKSIELFRYYIERKDTEWQRCSERRIADSGRQLARVVARRGSRGARRQRETQRPPRPFYYFLRCL